MALHGMLSTASVSPLMDPSTANSPTRDTLGKHPLAGANVPPSPSAAEGKRRARNELEEEADARKKQKVNDGSTSDLAILLSSGTSVSNAGQKPLPANAEQSSPLPGWPGKAPGSNPTTRSQEVEGQASHIANLANERHQSTPNFETTSGAGVPRGTGTSSEAGAPLGNDAEVQIDEPVLCPEQQSLVDLIVDGHRNVFYTGSAGCGKSTVLKAAVKKLHSKDLNVQIVAPTGRAALQVNGKTTWTFMGWTPDSHKYSIEKLSSLGFRKHVKKRLRQTHVLIIDEISMIENHHLERINRVLKDVRCYGQENPPAFGGLKVIVTGDFCQLPPVKPFQHCWLCGSGMEADEHQVMFDCPNNHGPFLEADKWAFKSRAWKEANFIHVNLEQIHRQKDEEFVRMLQKCRLGFAFSEEEKDKLMNHDHKVANATKLMCTRQEVSNYNFERFNKLKSEVFAFQALDGFKWFGSPSNPTFYETTNEDGTLVACKDFRIDAHVTLRQGMLVVLLVNLDLPAGLCNGSQGIICGFEDFDPQKLPVAGQREENDTMRSLMRPILTGPHASLVEYQIRCFADIQRKKKWPRVRFHNGIVRTIYPSCLVNSVGDEVPYSLLHRTQIPLVAGWALSVHKSQGMTLSRVIVNLTKAFEEGQVYVALSRAKTLEGLKIEGDSKGLAVGQGGNLEVQEFLEESFGSEIFSAYR